MFYKIKNGKSSGGGNDANASLIKGDVLQSVLDEPEYHSDSSESPQKNHDSRRRVDLKDRGALPPTIPDEVARKTSVNTAQASQKCKRLRQNLHFKVLYNHFKPSFFQFLHVNFLGP